MANEFFLGHQRTWYATGEASYGEPKAVKGTDAFRIISGSMTPAHEREPRPDLSGSSDVLERYTGRYSTTWEVTKLFLPNGNAVTQPDDYMMWRNLMGHVSTGSTSIEYTFATGHDDSLTIRDGVKTGSSAGAAEFQQHVYGAIVNRAEITWGNQGNNGLAQVTFSGLAKRWGYTGNSSVKDGNLNLGTNGLTLYAQNHKQFSVGSQVRIYDPTKGGGTIVRTINMTTGYMTITGTRGGTASGGRAMVPHNPTTTTAGSPIHARLGYLTLNGSTSLIRHLGGRVTVEDNRELLNEEVGYDSATQVFRSQKRNVTFALDFMLRKEDVPAILGHMANGSANHVQVTIGDQANKKLKLVMKNAQFDMNPLDLGEAGPARISMNGVALGTNGNDSLKVRIL